MSDDIIKFNKFDLTKLNKLNELPEGTHDMEIIDAKKWHIPEKDIGGITFRFKPVVSTDEITYKTTFIIYENRQLMKDSFAYKQLTEKLLPVFGLSYSDVKGQNFDEKIFLNKFISIEMIPTKKEPSKTWAVRFKPYVLGLWIEDQLPFEDDPPF